jgi:hypothetical protein
MATKAGVGANYLSGRVLSGCVIFATGRPGIPITRLKLLNAAGKLPRFLLSDRQTPFGGVRGGVARR